MRFEITAGSEIDDDIEIGDFVEVEFIQNTAGGYTLLEVDLAIDDSMDNMDDDGDDDNDHDDGYDDDNEDDDDDY